MLLIVFCVFGVFLNVCHELVSKDDWLYRLCYDGFLLSVD